MDRILSDNRLTAFFSHVSAAQYTHPDNIHEMFRSDLMIWSKDIYDVMKSGEINSSIKRARNKNYKPEIGEEFDIQSGDTFGRHVAPLRWKNAFSLSGQVIVSKREQALRELEEAEAMFNDRVKMWREQKAEA